MCKLFSILALLISLALTPAEAGTTEAMRNRVLTMKGPASAVVPGEASTCVFQSIACGQTINGSLDPGDCPLGDGQVSDFFQFNGTTGESVTATFTSADFPPFLDLLDPTPVSKVSDGEPTTAQVQFTLDSTGLWTLGVTNFNQFFESGNYSLSLACSSQNNGACTPDAHTLCLNNGRFQVTATFDTGHGNSGAAQVVSLTDDTGYLWFFASANVEAVVKVLNACALGGHYWVFAGGLTNVNVVLTVKDTQTNATRTYTNPQNTTFQPIQDTSAFSTCP